MSLGDNLTTLWGPLVLYHRLWLIGIYGSCFEYVLNLLGSIVFFLSVSESNISNQLQDMFSKYVHMYIFKINLCNIVLSQTNDYCIFITFEVVRFSI